MHAPHHDQSAIRRLKISINVLNPDLLVLLGDVFDCYQISSFDKDPVRLTTLQQDLDAGIDDI